MFFSWLKAQRENEKNLGNKVLLCICPQHRPLRLHCQSVPNGQTTHKSGQTRSNTPLEAALAKSQRQHLLTQDSRDPSANPESGVLHADAPSPHPLPRLSPLGEGLQGQRGRWG